MRATSPRQNPIPLGYFPSFARSSSISASTRGSASTLASRPPTRPVKNRHRAFEVHDIRRQLRDPPIRQAQSCFYQVRNSLPLGLELIDFFFAPGDALQNRVVVRHRAFSCDENKTITKSRTGSQGRIDGSSYQHDPPSTITHPTATASRWWAPLLSSSRATRSIRAAFWRGRWSDPWRDRIWRPR